MDNTQLNSFVEDHGFEPQSIQTEDYKIGIGCFPAWHTTLWRKNKDRMAWNQDNVSEWGNMSTTGLLFQSTSTIKIQLCWSRTKQTSLYTIETN